MTRIVKEHYPAERLPDDLRDGVPVGADVRITIEVLRKPLTREQMLAALEALRTDVLKTGGQSIDAVARVRELRDEWDD
jgi:hypothetical protein